MGGGQPWPQMQSKPKPKVATPRVVTSRVVEERKPPEPEPAWEEKWQQPPAEEPVSEPMSARTKWGWVLVGVGILWLMLWSALVIYARSTT